jgi:hypothetical protein
VGQVAKAPAQPVDTAKDESSKSQTRRFADTSPCHRDAHRELFLKAQEGYRKLVIEELDRMLADAKAGLPIRRSVTTEPSNHVKDYDRT